MNAGIAALAQTELCILGRTADEVASALRALGLRGKPNRPNDCVLARFLERAFPGEEWRVYDLGRGTAFFGPEGSRGSLQIPAACRAFAKAFDQGRYPDLVDPGRPA